MTDLTQGPGNGERELTFGEKAVGLTFNPGGHPLVDKMKKAYAFIIDALNEERAKPTTSQGAKRHYSAAITDAETAQMRAVKAVTWQFE